MGSLAGIIFTPDLDVDKGFIGDAIIRKKAGWFAEKIWDGLWYWYRRSLKHGSPLSHLPVISTYGRIAYLFLLLILIPHSVFYFTFSPEWDLMYVSNWYWNKITLQEKFIFGLMVSDTIHWTLDVCTTEHKETKIRKDTNII